MCALAAILLVACASEPAQTRAQLGAQSAPAAYRIGVVGAKLSAAASSRAPDGAARAPTGATEKRPATRAAAPLAPRAAGAQTRSANPSPWLPGAPAPVAVSVPTASSGIDASPQDVQPQPVRLGQALIVPPAMNQGSSAGSVWPWLLAILAGFAAALALAWGLRPRREAKARQEIMVPSPAPANDVDGPRRIFRREGPPPPRVTILAR